MSLVDKVIAAVTPPESAEARAQARAQARASAPPGSWFEMVLDHHLEIEAGFDSVASATSSDERRAAQFELAELMTAHCAAEENVLYPALALNDEKASAEMSYVEQSATKVQMAALEELEPMSQDYLDKLEHIRGAVAHHMYEEEGSRFFDLQEKTSPQTQDRLARRYREEFERCGGSPDSRPAGRATSRTTSYSSIV